MSLLKVLALCCMLASCLAVLNAPPIVDDFFSTTQLVSQHTDPEMTFPAEGTALFGSRTMRTVRTDGLLGASLVVRESPTMNQGEDPIGILAFSNDVGVTSTATVTWAGSPGVNLSTGGRDSFLVAACSLDQNLPVFLTFTAGAQTVTSGAVRRELDQVCSQDLSQSVVLRIPFNVNTLQEYADVTRLDLELRTNDAAIDAQFRYICTAPQLAGRTFSLPVPLTEDNFVFKSELFNPVDVFGLGTTGRVEKILFVPGGTQLPTGDLTLETLSVEVMLSNPAASFEIIDTPDNLANLLSATVGSLTAVTIDFMMPGDTAMITYRYRFLDDPDIPGQGTRADFRGFGTWIPDVEIVNGNVVLLNDAEFFARTNADTFQDGLDRCRAPEDIVIQFQMVQPEDDHICVAPVFNDVGCTCETFPCVMVDEFHYTCDTDAWYCYPVWRTGGWPENPTFYRASFGDVECTCPLF